MKFSWKNYYQLTPKNVKKVADGITLACATVTGSAMMEAHTDIALLFLIFGVIAKFFSAWFSN